MRDPVLDKVKKEKDLSGVISSCNLKMIDQRRVASIKANMML